MELPGFADDLAGEIGKSSAYHADVITEANGIVPASVFAIFTATRIGSSASSGNSTILPADRTG
jgi:hypothetical protein